MLTNLLSVRLASSACLLAVKCAIDWHSAIYSARTIGRLPVPLILLTLYHSAGAYVIDIYLSGLLAWLRKRDESLKLSRQKSYEQALSPDRYICQWRMQVKISFLVKFCKLDTVESGNTFAHGGKTLMSVFVKIIKMNK